MITETLPVPPTARHGAPCPTCAAPLAADQRYCLHCGVRRPEARLEFLDVLDADVRAAAPLQAPVAAPPSPAAAAEGLGGWLQARSGALALGAILLLTLTCGLLIGHWVSGSQPQAVSAPAAPQVVRIEGAGAAAAAPASSGAAATGASKAGSGSSSSKSSSAKAAKPPKNAVSVKSLTSKKAIEQAVKKGKPITTGNGKLPPTDNKAPGGGSSFETIG